jgi:hypothetical protein
VQIAPGEFAKIVSRQFIDSKSFVCDCSHESANFELAEFKICGIDSARMRGLQKTVAGAAAFIVTVTLVPGATSSSRSK